MTNREYLRRFGRKAMKIMEARLREFGVEFKSIGGDEYDNSIELYDVPPNVRLSAEVEAYFWDQQFSIVFVNHTDKWETHYASHRKGKPWRVSYPHKRGEPASAGILVEEKPVNWPQEWFDTGYAKIVATEIRDELRKRGT